MPDGFARSRGGDHKTGQNRQLGGEGLGGGDANLGPRMSAQDQVGLTCYRAFRHVDQGHDMLALFTSKAQCRQGVSSFSRLRDKKSHPALR